MFSTLTDTDVYMSPFPSFKCLSVLSKGASQNKAEADNEAEGASQKTPLPSQVLRILKDKKMPHLSLSNEQLEVSMVFESDDLQQDLGSTEDKLMMLQPECIIITVELWPGSIICIFF